MKETSLQTKPKLLDQVKITMRAAHYSKSTEESYVSWIKRFILFHNKRHPDDMGAEEIKAFINNLAINRHVSSSTQNQALSAILYLYKNVLRKEVGWLENIIRAHSSKRLPVVFTKSEVKEIFNYLDGIPRLVCSYFMVPV